MEHPVKEARNVIRSLTQGSPDEQQDAVYRYFLPGASFTHPFCRVPSFVGVKVPGIGELDSRALILAILKWYKILSPKIDLDIESCVFDQRTNLLYVKISQVFSIWLIPFHHAPVSLVTVLHLAPSSPSPSATNVNGTTGAAALPEHYDAAQEKLHSIQEGAEPSYAAVVAAGPEATGDHDKDKEKKDKDKGKAGGGGKQGAAAGGGAGGGGKGQQQPQQPQQQQRGTGAGAGATSSKSDAATTTTTTTTDARPTRYYIKKQEDLYQVNEFLKFVLMAPGASVYGAFQLLATVFCVVGVILLSPVMRAVGVAGKGKERVA